MDATSACSAWRVGAAAESFVEETDVIEVKKGMRTQRREFTREHRAFTTRKQFAQARRLR
jgi:hypothetical protein